MKFTLFVFIFSLLVTNSTKAQSLEESWQSEQKFRKTGMTVLGSWSAANIATGLVFRSQTEGTDRYFHEMNAIWGTVNLGIAAAGYFSARSMQEPQSALELYREQSKLDKTLLFNAGLDLAYIATGFYLTERAKNETANYSKLKGYGNSVIMQGAFLLIFDLSMVLIHKQFLVSDDMILSFNAAPGQFGVNLQF